MFHLGTLKSVNWKSVKHLRQFFILPWRDFTVTSGKIARIYWIIGVCECFSFLSFKHVPRAKTKGHLQVAPSLCLKARPSVKPLKWFFSSHANKRFYTWPRFDSESFWNSEMACFLMLVSASKSGSDYTCDAESWFKSLKSVSICPFSML